MIVTAVLTIVLALFYLDARGGGNGALFSPMNWLRDNGYFYIRDQFFVGLFLTPIAYATDVLYHNNNFWLVPLCAIGWTAGGVAGWNKTLLQMDNIKNFWPSFIRCTQFAGLYLLPAIITHNFLAAIGLAAITAAVIPMIYYLCYRASQSDKSTNAAEILTGAWLGLTSLYFINY